LAEPGIRKLGDFVQHSDITLLMHVRAVSWMTYTFCKTLGWDHVAAARAGILHDYVTYDWHVPDPSHRLHGFRHPGFAVKNSREITELSALEENMIRRHMWPLTVIPPKYKEAWALTLVDKVIATRETLRKYQKH
ncbi:MAG: HD family phosphohydrolase, partial [Clostridia bacterium]|nr:HD family phosphohydrolase [Clostridia bacterium]